MSGKSLSSEWLDMAEMDLNAAEYLLGMRPVPVEIICCHCEQAAEKLLKGALIHFDIEPPKTHDLIQRFPVSSQEKWAKFRHKVYQCRREVSPGSIPAEKVR